MVIAQHYAISHLYIDQKVKRHFDKDFMTIMKFESLPNEILILCFQFFNIFELFYSFDGLNNRFNQLIRSIPLNLNFKKVRKSFFDQFCTKILLDPPIKNQIYSLHLSNADTCGQIQAFLSYFSLHEFSNLHSLNLTQIEEEDVEKLQLMLPLIPTLHTFHSMPAFDAILNALPMSNLQILSVGSMKFLREDLMITNLTVYRCALNEPLFRHLPLLKYLKITDVSKPNDISDTNYQLIHLIRLIIGCCSYDFNNLETFFIHTPNLKHLNLYSDNETMINAHGWEHLITTSIPHLKIFKFIFCCDIEDGTGNVIREKLQPFESNFWQEHHWFVAYEVNEEKVYMYTLPFMRDTYTLLWWLNESGRSKGFHDNVFVNVTHIRWYIEEYLGENAFPHSKITTLTLTTSNEAKESLSIYRTDEIREAIDLSSLKYLIIAKECVIQTSSILLEILKETPQLFSLSINDKILVSFLEDNELCEYLNKMIKRLYLFPNYKEYVLDTPEKVENLCKVFSNVEEIICKLEQADDVLVLLNQLSKLSFAKVCIKPPAKWENCFDRFENEARKLNAIYYINDGNIFSDPQLDIWIG